MANKLKEPGLHPGRWMHPVRESVGNTGNKGVQSPGIGRGSGP